MRIRIDTAFNSSFGLAIVFIYSLISVVISAETIDYVVAEPIRMDTLDGSIVVLPNTDFNNDEIRASGGLAVRSRVVDDRRLYEVHYKGKKHTASIPLESPKFRLVFNPKKRMFDQMLSSVRVELSDYEKLDEIVQNIDGTSGKAYVQLGYAIIGLKHETHPLQAVEALKHMPEVVAAEIRLKGPPKRYW